jgi:L-rhamnose mutarotase
LTRVGFLLHVRPDCLDEYRARHAAVWPDMLDALRRHGWGNYSLFLRPDGSLFGYVEVAGTFEEALAGMATEEVNTRWQTDMAPFFDGVADTMMEQLDEVFHLD